MKKSLLKVCSAGLLSLFAICLHAQTIISGKITDAADGEALIGATVLLKGTSVGALTDIDGTYSLKVPAGADILLITYTGYRNQEVKLGTGEVIDVALEQGVELDVVVVSASRKEETLLESPAAVSVIEARKIVTDLSASPISLLRNTAGVDVAQNGVSDGHITIRGRSLAFTTETFIISDYRNVLLPSFGALQYGQQPIDAIDLERVEIVKGPSGAIYGPGVESGVVHFISKSPFKEQGTSISIGAGNQSQLQAAFRHAGVTSNGKLGYKITGYYREAQEFEVDTTEAAVFARVSAYPSQVVSAVDGSFVAPGDINYNILNYGFSGMLEYKFAPSTSLIARAGYGKSEGIFRSANSEGYMKPGRPFAQLRFQSEGFSAQAFWSEQQGEDGETWLYASGQTNVNIINQFEGQAQYKFNLADAKLNFVAGADYRMSTYDTQGTINGRFEDIDDYAIYGIFLQGKYKVSPKFDIIAATRVDQFTALDETSVAPRVALVYKPKTGQTARVTWNKAVGAPLSLNLYSDFPVVDRGAFKVHLHGGVEPLTYDNPEVYSFITQSLLPNTDFPLNVMYGAATAGINASGALSPEAITYLNSELANIAGTTTGATTGVPLTRDKLVPSETNMYEIGYKGFFDNKLSVTVDAYYINRKNNFTGTTVASPLVVYPSAGGDLATVVAATLNADSLAQFGLTPASAAAIYQGAIESVTVSANGAPAPLGLISADQSPNSTTLDATFFNIEEVDYYGVEAEVKYFINSDLSVFTNVSWLSDNYWEAAKITGKDVTTPFALNQPDLRFRIGADFLPTTGVSFNAAYRYNGEYQTQNGVWSGTVDAVSLVDLSAGYNFDEIGLRLNASVNNVLNADYRPAANYPVIGRIFLAKATYQF